jgi:mannose/fructose/N-acetylgalactosamine-specific phosphotransferase system component IIC
MAWRFLLAGLLGTVCYLDRTAACQLMLHRPLVVATVMGAVFGNFTAGAQVGAVLELLYLARLPVGASVPPDDTGAAIFAGAGAAAASSSIGLDAGSFTALILMSALFAEVGRGVDRMVRKLNGRIAHLTLGSVDRGDLKAVEHGLLAGLMLFAAVGAIVTLAFSGAGVAVAKVLLPRFGPGSRVEFSALEPLLPLIGAASVYSCGRIGRTAGLFFLSMAAMFGATLALRWVG